MAATGLAESAGLAATAASKAASSAAAPACHQASCLAAGAGGMLPPGSRFSGGPRSASEPGSGAEGGNSKAKGATDGLGAVEAKEVLESFPVRRSGPIEIAKPHIACQAGMVQRHASGQKQYRGKRQTLSGSYVAQVTLLCIRIAANVKTKLAFLWSRGCNQRQTTGRPTAAGGCEDIA